MFLIPLQHVVFLPERAGKNRRLRTGSTLYATCMKDGAAAF